MLIPYDCGMRPVPTTQNDLRPDVIELAFGEPDPSLLPAELIAAAAARVVSDLGRGVLAYGKRAGPRPLREALAARIATREGRHVSPDDVYVTAGNSQALDLVLGVFTQPGDLVLVESPTYSLALRTMRDHPVDIAAVRQDGGGLDVDDLRALLERLASQGRAARLLYTIPTFHNPAGTCLEDARRRSLLDLAREHGFLVVEDDVYRELAYDHEAPPALWCMDPDAPVLRLGSLSKSLAPGLRVGWVNARADLIHRMDAAGVLDSGGSVAQFAACVAALSITDAAYDRHVERLRGVYASRRDALTAALREHVPAGRFAVPGGGFFIWLELPAGVPAGGLLPFAERHGVAFAPGPRFCLDGGDSRARLAFSLYDEDHLREGARRLGAALRDFAGVA